MKTTPNRQNESGQVLIFSLIFVLIMMAFSGVMIFLVHTHSQQGQLGYLSEQALNIAEAGVDKALYEINQAGGLSYTGESDVVFGSGMYSVTVSDVGSGKVIEGTGYIPNSTSPRVVKKVRVTLSKSSAGASFIYGVQVGFGGLLMTNNSSISGSVYSDGNIQGQENTVIVGDAYVAGGVSPNPDQEQALQTGEQNVGETSAREDAAQSFVPAVNQTISRVSLNIKKVGNPSNATVRIVSDNANSPSQVTLAQGTLNSNAVGTGFGWVDVSFTSNPGLISGQRYWLVVDVNVPNGTRYYVWAKHDNSGYGNGVGKYSDDWAAATPVWLDAAGDFGFQTWMGSGSTYMNSVIVGGDAHANTIVDSQVGGDAYYQTITNTTVSGAEYPGSSDPPALDMPISDAVVEDFKSASEAGGTIVPAGGVYLVDGAALDLGPVKIEGDLIIDNGSVVTLTGPVWVEGDITISNNSIVQLDSQFSGDSTMVIADYPADRFLKGKILIDNNAQFFGSGDPDSYIMLLSTFGDLSTAAIDVKNNTDGVIFYTTQGVVNVANNVTLKEVVAYRLELANNAAVNYESGLANVNFSAGPSGGWTLKKGSWQIVSP